jgi:hypothetical protein
LTNLPGPFTFERHIPEYARVEYIWEMGNPELMSSKIEGIGDVSAVRAFWGGGGQCRLGTWDG